MNRPDELGIHADFRRVSITTTLLNVLLEIFHNREHSPDTKVAKFLFMRFNTPQGRFFILGTNNYRTKESIEKEHTPFKFNESKADTVATISARGYGAKLFPFHVRGLYSNLFRLNDSDSFSSDITEWGMKDWIDMDDLCRTIDDKKEFDANDFRSKWLIPMNRRPDTVPFFYNKEFSGTAVDLFMREHNFKYFYQFMNYNDEINAQLEDVLYEIAKIYRNHNVEIYYSINFEVPKKILSKKSYGIHPDDWIGAITFDCRIGEYVEYINTKNDEKKWFYKSQFRTTIMGYKEQLWGRIGSNGSKDHKFNPRIASFTPDTDKLWEPEFSVTLATVSKDYKEILEGTQKLDEMVYLRMKGEIISIRNTDRILNNDLRNTKFPSRTRIIIDILNESIKTDLNSGLSVTSVKGLSEIVPNKAIHQMASQALKIYKSFLTAIIEKDKEFTDTKTFTSPDAFKILKELIEKDKKSTARNQRRKKEGLLFEANVYEKVSNELKEITINDMDYPVKWEECNDAIISAKNDIVGQGIDSLGKLELNDYSIWILIQCKDRESALPQTDLNKFTKTVREFKKKKLDLNPTDKFISILSLAKEKSFNYKQYHDLLITDSIFTIIESTDDIGNSTTQLILSVLSEML